VTFGDAWLGIDAPPAPRRPVAGWTDRGNGCWHLTVAHLTAIVSCGDDRDRWRVSIIVPEADGRRCEHVQSQGSAEAITAAQLAAEDALRAVLVDAAAALGLRVVPS
jgi:hypothetical protein